MKKLLFIVNNDHFFLSHRLPIALEAKNQGYEVHLAAKVTNKRNALEERGLIIHDIDLDRRKIGITLLREFFIILSIIKKINPDIVHLVTIKPVLLGGIAARLTNISAVVTAISGLGYMYSNKGFISKIKRKILSVFYYCSLNHKNQVVIFQNIDDKSRLGSVNRSIYTKSILIPGSGVDLSLYTVKNFNKHTPVVMFASRLLASKGVREFVNVAKIINKKESIARFVLVGSIDLSNPESITQKEIDLWRDEGNVEIWGHRNNMHEVIPLANIVVLPSYYGEGLPKVLIEAAACGRAVITTDHPGCRDAIINGSTGVLVPVKNVSLLSKMILNLISDPIYCENLGLSGRKMAEERFDINQVVSNHMHVYKELLSKLA